MRRFCTVTTTNAADVFNGNGVTTVFPLSFVFFEASSLVVSLVQADGTGVVKTLTTDYTVSGGDGSTGSVTTTSFTPASGERLLVERVEPATQGTDYVNNDTFDAETTERQFDRVVMMIQTALERVGRSLKITSSDFDDGVSAVLPTVDGEGAQYLRVKPDESGLEWAPQGTTTAASSDATPQEVGTAAATPGAGLDYSRSDHVHQLTQGARTAKRLSLYHHGA